MSSWKTYSKRGDPARRWRSFRRHVLLMAQPVAYGLLAALAYVLLHRFGIAFPKEDEVVITGGVIAPLAIAFSILAAVMVSATYDRYRSVTECLLRNDKETFLIYRDERLPIVLHILLWSCSMPIVASVMMLTYGSWLSGYMAVFFVTFAIMTYLVALIELQDPTKSPWFAERIPKDWLADDVDELIPSVDVLASQ
ncbi:MAG TPA: hypothetical protein VF803_03390 [Candidatus Paceibacterota bacterium]